MAYQVFKNWDKILQSKMTNYDSAEQQRVTDFSLMVTNQNTIINSDVVGYRYCLSTDTFVRLGSVAGLAVGQTLSNFDNIMPWCGMRRCNLDDNKNVLAYYGEAGYKEDGSNGQCMVEVPEYFYRRYFYDADHLDVWISPVSLPGYKRSPWHYDKLGATRSKAYFSAFEGSIYDVSASATEIETMTVTAGCITSGTIIVRINSTDYNVAVVAGDDVNTVATKIRATAFTGWTISGTNADIIFTCNKSGAKKTAGLLTNTLGVTATVVVNTTGAGGYIDGDAQCADFTVTTGDKLCSIAGVKPASGVTQLLTIGNSRKLANNRGEGWEQQFFTAVSAIQMLFVVEYASLNSQSCIGQGVVNKAYRSEINDSELTGATSSLGNKSGMATGTNGLVSISYRGIENFWSNIYKWVDGFNIKDGFAYISNINGNFISDVFTGQYIKVGELAHVDGYMSKALINGTFDYGFLPSEALGTSSTKYADRYYQNAVGAFVARLGGIWADGLDDGAFDWRLANGSGSRYCYIGARLVA